VCRRFESCQARCVFHAYSAGIRLLQALVVRPFCCVAQLEHSLRKADAMSKRRGRGEGSIYKRKDGSWVAQYHDGNRRRYIYGKTRKDVAARLSEAIAERDSGLVYDSENLKVADYLDRWLDAIRDTLRERTWQRHEEITRLHLKPTIGSFKLDKLDALRVQTLYRSKLDSGLSPRTVQIIHATLYKALKQAVKWLLMPRNVCDAVTPPRAPKSEIRPLDVQQVKRLLKKTKETQSEFYALYVLAVTTGMRSGELLGLQWRDVDLESGTLRVNRTVFNGKVNMPKTAKSRRSIKLTRAATRALNEHPRAGEWVFSSRAGTSISVHNLYNRSWKPLLRDAGLPHFRFHDLRHTCATLLLTKGVHPKIVQELLGHSSIEITLDTYSHVLPSMGDKAADAMDDTLS
jgi:integrase